MASGHLAERSGGAADGLAAYRRNAAIGREQAMAAAFPTVRKMVGACDFGYLVRRFIEVDPPKCGDLGEWGAGFPGWLAVQSEVASWPYLGDSARLDLRVHQCERAADAELDMASLRWLESAEPTALCLRLMPGTAALASRWPIATIHREHQRDEPDFVGIRSALVAGSAEQVLVVRDGWRAVVQPIDLPTFEWTRSLLEGRDLASALDGVGVAFDFAGWLAAAVAGRWLQAVERI